MTAPQITRKLRKIATSSKRRWIGRGKFYKKTLIIFYQEKFEVTGGQKMSNFLKIGLFSQNIAIISITILASRIVRQPNDSPESPLSICALRLVVSLIL